MPGAMDQRLKNGALSNVERPDTLGRIELVTGERKHVHAEFTDPSRYLSHGLSRVCVKQDAVLLMPVRLNFRFRPASRPGSIAPYRPAVFGHRESLHP